MLTPSQEIEIGTGVIDCAISEQGDIILAGDVSGRGVMLDAELAFIWEADAGMPIWGCALDTANSLAAFALADKPRSVGGLQIYDYAANRLMANIDLPAPAWDTVIDAQAGMVFATTWGAGLAWYNLESGESGRLESSEHLFGMQLIASGSAGVKFLSLTVSGLGVVALIDPDQAIAEKNPLRGIPLIQTSHACYKHCFGADLRTLYVGSASGVVGVGVQRDEPLHYSTQNFRSLLRDVCGVASVESIIVYGGLSGEIQVARQGRPGIPIAVGNVGGGVWSLVPDVRRASVWMARGDGFLASYPVHELETSGERDEIVFGPGSLGGTKVFLSYASQDYDTVADLYRYLKTVGCVPWMDRFDLLPGQEWRDEILRALAESDFILLCLSEASVNKRGYVQKEVKKALDLLDELPDNEIFLIPARLEECTIPPSLARKQWVDLFREEGLRKLCLAIHTGLVSRGIANQNL
jgi:TIR domain